MSTKGIFTGMDAALMNGLNSVVQGQMSLYSSMMAGLVTGSATLYILWRAYQTLAGKLHTPVEDVVWDLAKMGIVIVFVLNIDGYLDATIAAINGLKSGFSGSDNVWVLLDTLWSKAQVLGEKLFNLDNSYVQINGGFAEIMVWGGAIFTLVIATVVNLGAEIMLLLMTATAPIFIFCLIYGFLRPMFNNWLQVIFTAILTLMFSALSLRIAIQYLGAILEKANSSAEASNIVTLGAQCLLAGIGAGFVVWLSAKIAGALAGTAVQGAIQGAAKIGALAAAGKTISSTRSAARSLGDGAEKRLNATPQPKISTPETKVKAASKAAVTRMKAINHFYTPE